ncbi:MAG: NRDE family protein [Deltaproteobacteria bacterium]|nr:NRDE family protein [Deltaproteobacteria bacterium]MBW1928837.1 NRDE family protein [Deltaproteobacteria bacterium]MBW2026663.1 NRDE family protein [Deltaproteobacteria bacterium]MBW2127239.1 NRDE family protein [Deltaproteobacteria bacterium]
MCLLIIAYRHHPYYPLILLANRDEYYERPTAPAHFWKDAPWVLGGKDLRGGGTWLGITHTGRIAAITNYRDPAHEKKGAPSRGMLVKDFLVRKDPPLYYLQELSKKSAAYNGFNLIVGQGKELYWYSNRGQGIRHLSPGIIGLSNHLLDTPWPKVVKAKKALARLLSSPTLLPEEAFFEILLDRRPAKDSELPDTGVGLEWERILSPIFITSPVYGTRSSTLIFLDHQGEVTFVERTHDPNGPLPRTRKYQFRISSTARP